MAFTKAAFQFLRGLKANNNKAWFEAHRANYEQELCEPMRALIIDMNTRFQRFAPEIGGDPKRGMFRINRDIRFSKDKSPYKTRAACWFSHRAASSKVGSEAEGGSAGFYFHVQPSDCYAGGGLWMPPRPTVDKLRAAIDDDHAGFSRVMRSLQRFGGLGTDHDAVLKRMPRGYDEDHPAAKWLKYKSFVAGRKVPDSVATSARLEAHLEKEFRGLLPLVRWLNSALGLRPAR